MYMKLSKIRGQESLSLRIPMYDGKISDEEAETTLRMLLPRIDNTFGLNFIMGWYSDRCDVEAVAPPHSIEEDA